MVEPMAETSATVEPEIPEKMYSATTTAIERPPRIHPTSTWARRTRRTAMPPVSIRAPARMKRGIASRTKESTPSKICFTTTVSGYCPLHHNPRKPETPITKATGTPIPSRTKKETAIRVIMPRPVRARARTHRGGRARDAGSCRG